jgi:hypothetical protein
MIMCLFKKKTNKIGLNLITRGAAEQLLPCDKTGVVLNGIPVCLAGAKIIGKENGLPGYNHDSRHMFYHVRLKNMHQTGQMRYLILKLHLSSRFERGEHEQHSQVVALAQ